MCLVEKTLETDIARSDVKMLRRHIRMPREEWSEIVFYSVCQSENESDQQNIFCIPFLSLFSRFRPESWPIN